MNTPTKTLASDLLAIADALLTGKSALSARESASRLLAQHATMTKQDERIAALEAELEEVRGYYHDALDSSRTWKASADENFRKLDEWKDRYDASELTHAATRADLQDCRLALESERALADRLAALLQRDRDGYGGQVVNPRCKCQDCEYLGPIDEALAAWKDARRA